VALQGTIDTFPLADVLQLLSASSKTGRLLLDGDRGQMTLWIDNGDVIGGEGTTPTRDRAELLLFEMLRFTDGAFEFDSDLDGEPGFEVVPAPLEASLHEALELLESWSAIEAVVPSPAHQVTMTSELQEPTIEIDRATWRLLTVTGRSVAEAAVALEMDEFSATSAIAELVEAGVLEIGEPSTGVAEVYELYDTSDRSTDQVDEQDDDSLSDGTALDAESNPEETTSFPDRFPIDDLIGGDDVEEDDPWSSPEMERLEAQRFAAAQSFDAVEVEPVPLGGPLDAAVTDPFGSHGDIDDESSHDERPAEDTSDESTDEVLRQMSKLSPKAAEAIAAALNSVPSGAGERHDSAGDDDGPISFSGTF
jgi:hypothetical protein